MTFVPSLKLIGGTVTGDVDLIDARLKIERDSAANRALQTNIDGESQARFYIGADGDHSWGDGTNPVDTTLTRPSANILRISSGDKFQQNAAPTTGDDLTNKTYVDDNTGSLTELVTFTASGTFTKASYSGLKYVRVRAVGGGGGSGGNPSTSGTENAVSGGAGGGEYAESVIAESALAANETVTIGAGGAGGAAGANAGTAGSSTTFGTHVTANGGSASGAGNATSGNAYEVGAAGGTGGTGDLVVDGDSGGAGVILSGIRTRSNDGGSSMYSPEARASNLDAFAGVVYGGGAGGCNSSASNAARAGAAGADGIVIVEIYN